MARPGRKPAPAGPLPPTWNVYRFPDGKVARACRLTTNDKLRARLLESQRTVCRVGMLLHDRDAFGGQSGFHLNRAMDELAAAWDALFDEGLLADKYRPAPD